MQGAEVCRPLVSFACSSTAEVMTTGRMLHCPLTSAEPLMRQRRPVDSKSSTDYDKNARSVTSRRSRTWPNSITDPHSRCAISYPRKAENRGRLRGPQPFRELELTDAPELVEVVRHQCQPARPRMPHRIPSRPPGSIEHENVRGLLPTVAIGEAGTRTDPRQQDAQRKTLDDG